VLLSPAGSHRTRPRGQHARAGGEVLRRQRAVGFWAWHGLGSVGVFFAFSREGGVCQALVPLPPGAKDAGLTDRSRLKTGWARGVERDALVLASRLEAGRGEPRTLQSSPSCRHAVSRLAVLTLVRHVPGRTG
jgi:hypothetical protein